jgi:hypothetical protein
MPPLPVPVEPLAAAARSKPVPLQYLPLRDDVEAELARDFRWSLYGIVTFAAVSVVAVFVLAPQMDIDLPAQCGFVGVAILTALTAAWLIARHRRARAEAGLTGVTTRRTTGERIGALVALGFVGIVATAAMLFLTAVALVILLLLVCLGGGFKI